MNSDQGKSFEDSNSGKGFIRRSGHAFCPVCSKQVELMSFDNAASLFHTDLQDIEFLAKHGECTRYTTAKAI